jgi:3',5'-cyclic AMP phosphodiesterase CpdA
MAESTADFPQVEPDSTNGEAFSFVFFTDVHLKRGTAEQPFAEVLEDIRRLTPRPAFCVNGGDIELQAGMGEAYCELLADFPLPVYHVAGNHDLLVGRQDPQQDPWKEFTRLFGPAQYSWDHGRFHFVVLAAMVPNPAQEGWRNVEGELTAAELAWLEADLRQAGGRPVIVFLHIPPVSTFPARRGRRSGEEPAWEVRGAGRLLELCAACNVRLVLSGHFHENERTWVGDTEFLATGAVCGHWWERGGRPAVNLDGSPKGYRIAYIEGTRIRTVYKPTGGDARRQLSIGRPRHGERITGPLEIVVNVFDGDEHTRVERSLDGGGWVEMHYTPQSAIPACLSSAHCWTDMVEEPLPRGASLLAVRAAFTPGETYTERVVFEVV